MTEEWVKLWYQCLCENRNYTAYCAARDGEAPKRAQELEAMFPTIAGIYVDFGKTLPWITLTPQEWSDWFASHRHLFMHSARIVDDLYGYESRQGFLLLEVPVQADPKATAALLVDHIATCHTRGEVEVAPAPKYQLHMKDGRPAAGYEQVRKACAAGYLEFGYSFNHDTFVQQDGEWEDASHRVLITQIARYELDTMGWSLDPKARKQLEEEGTLSDERFESFKTMLNRSRREFKLLTANVLKGRFPDLTPQVE